METTRSYSFWLISIFSVPLWRFSSLPKLPYAATDWFICIRSIRLARMAMEMEENLSSTVSNSGTTTRRKRTYQLAEASAVSSFTDSLVQESRRLSHYGSSNLSSNTKFKGVVLQQNGHWGAQIYANHNRVWLGTFNSEVEAAMAYDSAAIKLRNGECQRNFAWTKFTDQEPYFQNLYSQEAVLNMIKDGSYRATFIEFLMARHAAQKLAGPATESNSASKRDLFHKQLFQKELTPSDVGKLNRLVIPKNYATKYFPRIDEEVQGGPAPAPDVQLSFYDQNMRPWKFRYCYWKSSQSFVFTRGWNRFVKESLLKANDTIRFYECHIIREGDQEAKSFYMIKIDRAETLTPLHDKKFELNSQVIDEFPQVNGDSKRIRLFGVCIDIVVGQG